MVVYSTVLYANKPDGHFDVDYYLKTHMPLVAEQWGPLGLQDWKVVKLSAGMGGAAPDFTIQAILHWNSAESIKTATESEAAKIVFGDVKNFTNIAPQLVMGDYIGEQTL